MLNVQLPGFGYISVQRTPTPPDTDHSTAATVEQMSRLIRAACNDSAVIAAASEALIGVPDSAPAWRKAEAIFAWVKAHCRFVSDEQALAESFGLGPDNELLIRPELFVQVRRGDCDDFTMLSCAMLRAAGVDYRIVTIAADPEEPTRWSHVFAVVVLENGARVPIDTSHGPYLGWESPRQYRRREWPA